MHRKVRGTNWTAAASGLLLAAGVLAGAGVAANAAPAESQPVRAHLAYACRFPSGLRQVAVTVFATFPATVAMGQPIQPAGLRVAAALPHPAVSDLTGLGAATVTGGDLLTASVGTAGAAHGANAATARWPGQVARPLPVPATGGLQLVAAGPVSPLTVSSPGTVTLTATGLSLTLTPRKTGGAPTNPATLRVTCALNPGQDAKLAAIQVISPSPSPSASATPSPRAPKSAAPASPHGKPPKGCAFVRKLHIKKIPQIACGYITGFANVNKLSGSALLQPAKPQKPGLLSLALGVKIILPPPGKPCCTKQISKGVLFFRGKEELPPTRATFLGFGFVPITATLEVKELKPITVTIVFQPNSNIKTTGTTKVSFQLSNATVNGVPWKNLGSHCQTSKPIKLRLVGRGNTANQSGFWNFAAGGTLGGFVKVPPFTGCGVGENLNPLFTASISGPKNFDLMTQGALCFVTPRIANCPPKVPKPKRHLDTGHS